jgi:hypothetical protein
MARGESLNTIRYTGCTMCKEQCNICFSDKLADSIAKAVLKEFKNHQSAKTKEEKPLPEEMFLRDYLEGLKPGDKFYYITNDGIVNNSKVACKHGATKIEDKLGRVFNKFGQFIQPSSAQTIEILTPYKYEVMKRKCEEMQKHRQLASKFRQIAPNDLTINQLQRIVDITTETKH